MTRLVNEADIVNKTRPLFTLSLEMTRLVNETRLLLGDQASISTQLRIYTYTLPVTEYTSKICTESQSMQKK